MSDQERAKDEALRQMNLIWRKMQEAMEAMALHVHSDMMEQVREPLFGRSPVDDPAVRELNRIMGLESPK